MFGVSILPYSSVHHLLLSWFSKAKSKGHITILIPSLILWTIWEARNKSKYDGIKISSSRMIHRVSSMVYLLGISGVMNSKQWSNEIDIIPAFGLTVCPPSLVHPKVLRWIAPPPGTIKLNIDGSYANSRAGGGGIFRDTEGSCIRAFGSFYGNITVIEAELKAIHEGLQIWNELHGDNLLVETDSLLATQLISTGKGSWKIRHLVSQIQLLLSSPQVSLTHIYRESNSAADYLAKTSVALETDFSMSPHCMTSSLKAILITDLLLPSIRAGHYIQCHPSLMPSHQPRPPQLP